MVWSAADVEKERKAAEADGREMKECYEDNDEHQILRKQVTEAIAVSKQWASSKQYDEKFGKVYRGAVVFLSTAPACPMPFP
eukprot:6267248-Pyramimonas_sp.AAC.1